jgi:hypothetical protein
MIEPKFKVGDKVRVTFTDVNGDTAYVREVRSHDPGEGEMAVYLLRPANGLGAKWKQNEGILRTSLAGKVGYWFAEEFVEGEPIRECPRCEQPRPLEEFESDYLCLKCRFG